jgi:hypothetical protein
MTLDILGYDARQGYELGRLDEGRMRQMMADLSSCSALIPVDACKRHCGDSSHLDIAAGFQSHLRRSVLLFPAEWCGPYEVRICIHVPRM